MDYRCYRRRIGLSHVRHRIRNYHGIYIEFIYIRHEKQGIGWVPVTNEPAIVSSFTVREAELFNRLDAGEEENVLLCEKNAIRIDSSAIPFSTHQSLA